MEKKYFVVLVDGEEVETSIESEYQQQAMDFLKDTETTMKIVRIDKRTDEMCFNSGNHYDYEITLKRNGKSWKFQFCDSINNRQKNILPTAYDVLACLQTYEVDTDILEFCNEFGYELNTIEERAKVRKLHKSVLKEYEKVIMLFEDVIDELAEIQ